MEEKTSYESQGEKLAHANSAVCNLRALTHKCGERHRADDMKRVIQTTSPNADFRLESGLSSIVTYAMAAIGV